MKTELTEIIAAYKPNNNPYIHEDDVVGIAEDYAAQFQQEWVDVKDSLPEEQEAVLVYMPKYGEPNIQVCWRADWADGKAWFNVHWKTYPLQEVTHWQPIPSPPKEK